MVVNKKIAKKNWGAACATEVVADKITLTHLRVECETHISAQGTTNLKIS